MKRDRAGRPYLSPVFYQDEDLQGDISPGYNPGLQMGQNIPVVTDWKQFVVVSGATVTGLFILAMLKKKFNLGRKRKK